MTYQESDHYYDEFYEDGYWYEDTSGYSALRASSKSNPRNLPCPTCGQADRLTQADVNRHYQCDTCADYAEGKTGPMQ